MQRHLRPVQHPQQVRLVLTHVLQHLVDAGINRLLAAQGLEASGQHRHLVRLRLLPIRFQVLVQLPNLLPDLLDDLVASGSAKQYECMQLSGIVIKAYPDGGHKTSVVKPFLAHLDKKMSETPSSGEWKLWTKFLQANKDSSIGRK